MRNGPPQQIDEDDDYDPHLHREVKKPTNNFESIVNLLKGCIGTGIWAMPEAFKFAGMAVGIVSTFIISFLCTYCIHVLIRSQYVICKKKKVPLLTYPELMKAACEMGPTFFRRFAPCASAITNFFLIVYQVGICCVYVVFVGNNVHNIGNYYLGPEKSMSITIYILMFFIPYFLIICIKSLKLLASFSLVANIITFITFGVVGYYVSQKLQNFGDLAQTGTFLYYPLYFGTTMFSLQSIGVVMAVENNMASPKSFRKPFGVLNIAAIIVTLVYVFMGVIGYWRYGADIEPSIILNFPLEEILTQTIMLLYSFAIYISYGLQGYVPIDIIWKDYIEMRLTSKKLLYSYLLRLAFVVLTLILGVTIPLFGLFISLVGAFCLSMLGITFPAIIEISAYWPAEFGPGRWIFWKDIFLVVFGIICIFVGTYCCVFEIVRQLLL